MSRRKVSAAARGARQFRARILRMLKSRIAALDDRVGWGDADVETKVMRFQTERLKRAIEDMR